MWGKINSGVKSKESRIVSERSELVKPRFLHQSFICSLKKTIGLKASSTLVSPVHCFITGVMTSESLPTLRVKELKSHDSSNDCWIAVHSKVYDVTGFLDDHPGGSASLCPDVSVLGSHSPGSVILKYAGQDATAAYDEVHAPGILEESLSPETCKGILDQAEVVILPDEQKQETLEIERTRGQSISNRSYTKPDLYKLISLSDFEEVAKNTLTTKAWAFYSSAATDLITHHLNSNLYRRIMLRPRVMRNIANVKTDCSILGIPCSAPFFVSPAAMARLAHPDGELALARGSANEGILQCVSHS